jgi:DNA-binding MarR family transcriptional regulator
MSEALAIGQLADSLGRVARHAMLPRFTETVADRAGVALDRSAFVLLAKLVDGPWRVGELADHLNLDISTVSRQIAGLETAGFAHRERHPDDRRGWLVVIDDAGVAAVAAHRKARRGIFEELLGEVSAEDVAVTAAVLARLAEGLESLTDGFARRWCACGPTRAPRRGR